MNPVWLVRSRQMTTRFRFWLLLSGYDPNDHSISHKIYLVYASFFWSLWIFAVLALAASGLAGIFKSISPGHEMDTAVLLEAFCLFAWALYSAYSAARRSPIVFSEDDAYLICLTPVDRRQVTLAWLVGDWPYTGIPFWVIGSILGFTLMEVRLNGHVSFNNIPDYIISALICLSILLPLQFGMMASIWAFGATRIQGEKDKKGLLWVPVISGMFIIVAWMVHYGVIGSPGWVYFLSEIGLNSFLLPVKASLGSASWLAGEIISFLWVVIGVTWLAYQSVKFNLSRAAQETSLHEAHQNAVYSLNQDVANEISIKQQLGVEKPPINLPIPAGSGAMIWKDVVQIIRSIQISAIFIWVQLFGAAFGLFIAQAWGLRLVCLFLWIWFSNRIFSQRLRLDLRNWEIFTQLPFGPLRLILMDVSLPVIGGILVNWMALWIASRSLSIIQSTGIALLIPGVILGMALITTWDILKQCDSSSLLAGVVPGVDIWSFVLGTIGIVLPFAVFAWMVSAGVFLPMPYIGALFVNFIILFGLSRIIKNSYRNIH
jgi:hypothetical protein